MRSNPLRDFEASAARRNLDTQEATEALKQREQEAASATLRLLPTLFVLGTYTRNQYEIKVSTPGRGTATFAPRDQLDAVVRVELPVFDLGAWQRRAVARSTRDAQRARVEQTTADVQREVARSYHQVVGLEALKTVTERAVRTAEENVHVVSGRRAAGTALELDVHRAQLELEQRKQALVEVEGQLAVARRNLETLSGLAPSAGGELPEDDLHDEARLAAWEERSLRAPNVRAAVLDASATEHATSAANADMYPTIIAFGQDRYTNAAGFQRSAQWALGVQATWRLDFGAPAAARAAKPSAEVAKVRAERVRTAARDSVFAAWHAVKIQLAKCTSARNQQKAAHETVRIVQERCRVGPATAVEMLDAEREAFMADALRTQADAELAFSRIALHLLVGDALP